MIEERGILPKWDKRLGDADPPVLHSGKHCLQVLAMLLAASHLQASGSNNLETIREQRKMKGDREQEDDESGKDPVGKVLFDEELIMKMALKRISKGSDIAYSASIAPEAHFCSYSQVRCK